MRVLLAHNFYRSDAPSGENEVFRLEKNLLEERGNEVDTFTRHSDELESRPFRGRIHGALGTPWNPAAGRNIVDKVNEFTPDVVHVHNTFPLLSPAIFSAIGRRSARVLTLHNYRLFCPAAIPMREGSVCTQCLDKRSPGPAISHGCYRNSRIATVPLAANVWLHRALGTWQKHVDAFICLTEFQKEVMIDAGLPREKVHVKPNFYPGNPELVPWSSREPYVVFAGRLSPEKGAESLVRAWREWGPEAPPLMVMGDGPLRSRLEELASGLPVTFTGQLPPEQVQGYIARSKLLVLPSEWFEGFPMVIREAFAFGTPVAVSDRGPLPSIVGNGRAGLVFRASDPDSLLSVVRAAWVEPRLLESLSYEARAEYFNHYTEAANYTLMEEIYGSAIEVSRHG